MIIKGRSPTMRHVSRAHRVALDWLFDRINLDAKIQIKYVESKNQLEDIPTTSSFTRNERHNLLHVFNIMNDTIFHESKAKACCLVSRQCVSVGQNSLSNPECPESARYSQVWTWEERSKNSRCCSVQHASGNREYPRKIVQDIKDQLKHDESISEISINSEKMHVSVRTRFLASWDASSIAHGPELRKEFGNIQEF